MVNVAMNRLTLWTLGVFLLASVSYADELTDAILDVDPRHSLRSGTGVVYGSTYSPSDAQPLNPSDVSTLPYDLGTEYTGLRSPLYQSEETASPLQSEDLQSITVAPIPLGKPYQRDGVWYQDDLSSSPASTPTASPTVTD